MVKIERAKKDYKCNDCGDVIQMTTPVYMIKLDTLDTNIILCEDCANHLQNDINDETSLFWLK